MPIREISLADAKKGNVGGTDETILKYDISTLGLEGTSDSPEHMFREHEDTIRGLSCHPYQEDVFLSAAQDGRILVYDCRNGLTRAQSTLQLPTEATGVHYHPHMEHVFATSDHHGEPLRDQDSFTPRNPTPRYTAYRIPTHLPSVAEKTTLMGPPSRHQSEPIPIAVQSKYNGAFGSFDLNGTEFYSAGSEDFRGYVWKVPDVARLEDQRVEVSADDWASQNWSNTVAFTNGSNAPRYIPIDLSTPHCYLNGHQSIVNSTLFHPHLFYVLTCGIERDIILHGPTPTSPCAPDLQRTSTDVRRLEEDDVEDRAIYYRMLIGADEDLDGEITAIRMFDHILREEGNADIFDIRRITQDSSSEDVSDLEEVMEDSSWM
ncbi:hypothetical protein H0H87_004006 [Tephrocybe sp. NHM501043]|nr:hypothetical protein H0H87_004006 [Tephrocybe sp. NHM501043]